LQPKKKKKLALLGIFDSVCRKWEATGIVPDLGIYVISLSIRVSVAKSFYHLLNFIIIPVIKKFKESRNLS
jgi:hypothetical protein